MPHVAETVRARNDRLGPVAVGREHRGHLSHRVWVAARDVVRAWNRLSEREGEEVRAGDVVDVYEVAQLHAVFENKRRASGGESASGFLTAIKSRPSGLIWNAC